MEPLKAIIRFDALPTAVERDLFVKAGFAYSIYNLWRHEFSSIQQRWWHQNNIFKNLQTSTTFSFIYLFIYYSWSISTTVMAKMGLELATPRSAVGRTTGCSVEPGPWQQ